MADESFLTKREVAERLRCSTSTVSRVISDRRLLAVEVSERVVRVPVAEFERFVAKSRTDADAAGVVAGSNEDLPPAA